MESIKNSDKPVLVIKPVHEVDYMIEITAYLAVREENVEQVHI
jgi:hypothetical protein